MTISSSSADARQLVLNLGLAKAMPRDWTMAERDRVWNWLAQHAPPETCRELMGLAHWFWNSGSRDVGLIERLLDQNLRRKPEKPYGYFAPGGMARENRNNEHQSERRIAEHEVEKEATRRWLKGGTQ